MTLLALCALILVSGANLLGGSGMTAVDSFLRNVLRSGLLDRAELIEALRELPAHAREDADTVAEHLVQSGKLSRFQTDKLRRGMYSGLVLGPYQILAPIGRGGSSTVYLARDVRSGLLVALKVLPPQRARQEHRALARFRREMEMSQRVAHPHLAWTYEVGVHRGVYYIAMEYIPGRSLFRVVAEDGPLEVPRAARLFAEVASALDHAHNQGLIHRDLKPSNIMITPHDHAKLLDLGLALVQGEGPADRMVIGGPGYVVGTMDYVAPEQAEDPTAVDPRCDLYSLGCTLYYALTGSQPFPGGTKRDKIHRHRTEEPTPLLELNPTVPPGFVAVVQKLMAKRPEQRFATAAEVREELLRWAGNAKLPLDRAEDQEYRKAVMALERAIPAEEYLAEAIPVALPVARPRKPRRLRPQMPSYATVAARTYHWPGPAHFIVAGLWVLIFAFLVLALVLYWFRS